MIKNLIENAKLTAQKVMTKEQKSSQYEQFPQFDQLAFKNYSIPKENLWQYSVEELSKIMHQMEDYISRVQKGYEDICEQFLPMFNKFDMLEKERKRLVSELSEKESHSKELEQAMIEMQADADNELRKREVIECELELTKKELQTMQSQINWNHQIDDNEIQDFNTALMELDQSSDEQFKQRIEALQKEVQEYIQLNQDQLQKITLQSQEIEKQSQENRQINRNLNMVLQQFADQQSKSRQETESRQTQINMVLQENNKLITQLQKLDQQKTIELQIQLENNKLREEVQENKKEIQGKQNEIIQLQKQIEAEQKLQQQQNEFIKMLQKKRDIAISEISQMQQQQPLSDNNYQISVKQLKQIRFSLQNKLINMRKEFENMYKHYLTLICKIEDQKLSNELMKLESTVNKIVMDMQNLVDEVEDIMD